MSRTLYEIDESIRNLHYAVEKWAEEHDGDVTDFPFQEHAEILEGEKRDKLISIACWIKNLKADAGAIEAEEKKLAARKKAAKNKAKSLEGLISFYFPEGSEKIDSPRAVLSYRKNPGKVIVDNAELLPENMFKVEKKPILADIKKNLEILPEGAAHIEESLSLQIR